MVVRRLGRNDGRYLAERNGEVWAAYVSGETPHSIAERYDLSVASVIQICKKIREHIPTPDKDDLRLNNLELLHQLQAQIATIAMMDAPPAFTVTGKVLWDAENNCAVRDYRAKFQAVELVLKTSERIAKILGLDAPDRLTVTVDEMAREATISEAEAAIAARPRLALASGS
jgi:hypothetical protein